MTVFQPATRTDARLRLALIGPAGSGKTYSALTIARALGGKVALIDTEHGTASKYALAPGEEPSADRFAFDVVALDSFSPQVYIDAIHSAETAGYDVLIIDSLSHAWMGKDGALELVDRYAARERGNSFAAWRHVTPLHNELVDTMLGCRCHLIATLRAKTEYVQDKDQRTGKVAIRKVGLQPVQRDGIEFEFDVVGDLDQDNTLIVTKTRCPALRAAVIPLPGAQLAQVLQEWLRGAPAPAANVPPGNGKGNAGVPLSPIPPASAERQEAPSPAPSSASGTVAGAYDRYLRECQVHQERIGRRCFRLALADQGLAAPEEIPAEQRAAPAGLALQKRVLTALRAAPSLDSDEGFEAELGRIGEECLQSGEMTAYHRVLEQYVDTPIDADAAHVPAGKRLALLAHLERELSEPVTTEVPV